MWVIHEVGREMEDIKRELLIFRVFFPVTILLFTVIALGPPITDTVVEAVSRGVLSALILVFGLVVLITMAFYPIEAILMGGKIWILWRGTLVQTKRDIFDIDEFLTANAKNKRDFIFYSNGVIVAKNKNDAIILKLIGC